MTRTVETLYSKKTWKGPGELYKSNNKRINFPETSSEGKAESARRLNSFHAMEYAEDRSDRDAYIQKLLKAPAHNCTELTRAAAHFAHEMFPDMPTTGVNFQDPSQTDPIFGHTVLVLGHVSEEMLQKPVEEWDPSFAIVDPWARIAATPQLYRARLEAKLEKWANENKQVKALWNKAPEGSRWRAAWIDSTDPSVRNVLNSARRIDD